MISGNNDTSKKLAFSSRCLPGSPAEKQEQERLEAFRIQKAKQNKDGVEADEQRHQEFLDYCEVNKERIDKEEAAKQARRARWTKK